MDRAPPDYALLTVSQAMEVSQQKASGLRREFAELVNKKGLAKSKFAGALGHAATLPK